MPNLETLLSELEATADAYWNISRENAVFLSSLLKAMGAKRVLEVGTSNGYSALWFAEAVQQNGGEVITLMLDDIDWDAGRKLFHADRGRCVRDTQNPGRLCAL